MDHLKHNLSSLEKPSIPKNLEGRVLLAVHLEQQRSEIFWQQCKAISLIAVPAVFLASIGVFIYTLITSGSVALLQTIMLNYDAVPASNAFLAVVETLPLMSLTTLLISTTLLCLLIASKPSQTLRSLHLPFLPFHA